MPKCADEAVEFGRVGRRVVHAALDGGNIVSDGGVLLLEQVDARLGLTRATALAFGDERRGASVQHNVLRHDPVPQTAVGRAEPLASAPTLSRLETRATPRHPGNWCSMSPLHGEQERGHFHAHCDNCRYLPLT